MSLLIGFSSLTFFFSLVFCYFLFLFTSLLVVFLMSRVFLLSLSSFCLVSSFFFCLLVSCGSLFLFHILFISISLSSSLSPLLSCDWQLLQVLNFNESQSGAPLGDGISSFAIFSMLELFLSCVTSFSRDCVWWREGKRDRVSEGGEKKERGWASVITRAEGGVMETRPCAPAFLLFLFSLSPSVRSGSLSFAPSTCWRVKLKRRPI